MQLRRLRIFYRHCPVLHLLTTGCKICFHHFFFVSLAGKKIRKVEYYVGRGVAVITFIFIL